MQDYLTQSPIINIHSLATSWLGFSSMQKSKVFERLREVLFGEESNENRHLLNDNFKEISIKKEYFFLEQ